MKQKGSARERAERMKTRQLFEFNNRTIEVRTDGFRFLSDDEVFRISSMMQRGYSAADDDPRGVSWNVR